MSWTPKTLQRYVDVELRCVREQIAAVQSTATVAATLVSNKVDRNAADIVHAEIVARCNSLQRQIDNAGRPNYAHLIAASALVLAIITGLGSFVYSGLDTHIQDLSREITEHHASPGHATALERTEGLSIRLRLLENALHQSIPGEGTSRGGTRSPPDDRP